ncbi:FCD domain protein [Bordetella bronchiseptica GA96-01]|nr:FCD domain protein [Bordetella bronchiseptica GA96-01]
MRDWILKNQEFHALIYKNSGNALLGQIVSNLHLDYVKNVLSMMAPNMYESRIKKNIEHHSAIVEAMVARDSIAARHAMRTHIQESSEFVVDWLQKRPVPLRSRSGRSNLSV